MRVLNINKFHYQRGGVERYYFALEGLLKKNGHQVMDFSMKDKRNIKSEYSKYFVSNLELEKPGLNLIGHIGRPVWSKEAADKMKWLLNDHTPDIAHVHLLYHHLSPSILPVLKQHGIPIVMTLHDYKLICPNYLLYTRNEPCKRCKGHKYYNAILHRCIKNSFALSAYTAMEMSVHKIMQVYEKNVDMMIAPSKFVRDIFVEFGQDPKKIIVIPHFIDPVFIKQAAKIKPLASEEPYMLYFGRLSAEKGVDKILEMMYTYKPEMRLKIAGKGPLEKGLNQYIKDKSLKDKVEFVGHLQAKELIATIKGADMVIMPSQFYEPFGFSALETMALGIPLIASDIGTLHDLVPPELGVLFPYNDLEAMAKAVAKAKRMNKEKLAVKGREYVLNNYSPEKHYQALRIVYEHLL